MKHRKMMVIPLIRRRSARTLTVIILLFAICPILAQEPENFEQAKSFSAKQHRPILMEFVHED
ncbi:MAG: hypothetical protein JW763_10205 [candidate division Zixibacteria bacterium]|nr:hypothetical protein [candidate division Zixibacteria bacterium]